MSARKHTHCNRSLAQRLEGRIDRCLGSDRPRLRRRLAGLRRRRVPPRDPAWERLARDIDASEAVVQGRAAAAMALHFPPELPITMHCDEIAAALAAHQVVIVCGETGSGKTTQLPKLCLSRGRGAAGLIGHTQPRRIAARSVAMRIAEELGPDGAGWVGYKVRFHDRTLPDARIKLMTDGILLAEIQHDRLLESYDTLIIDEAHERSLNIDFLLGYLKQILPRRPDLKVIITSATIDPQRFARHFDAPVIEVSGRGYPVEIRYRPPEEDSDGDLQTAILKAVDELAREGPGDMLVFLSGERDIRDTAEALRKHHPPGTEILPLYARLSAAEQDRVFRPHAGRRIVLATNVAETSLTVPGIRYVIDTGLARISRYSHRNKVLRLPVEKISQAAASQRAGRCGRIAPGICIRLYSESDFLAREPYTPPEIRRTNLASVILRMKRLELGRVEDFPFMDPPDGRFVRDAYRLLRELQALDESDGLTALGRRLADLPVDPRLGRMILAGAEQRCLREILIIVSALSIQDPRERPVDRRTEADAAHARFQDRRSDFLGWLKLWEVVQDRWRHLSNRQFRRFCQTHFLSYRRLREWRDIHQQLVQQVRSMGLAFNDTAPEYAALHRAILSGLLGQVAVREEGDEYRGVRETRLRLFPGAAPASAPPQWIMAGELLETSRLYALNVARIEPRWIEEVGAHLVRRQYDNPHWHRRRGQVMAFETVTFHGLVLVSRRRIPYGRIDPETAHEIFIQALAAGEVDGQAAFARNNQALLEAFQKEENKLRRREQSDARDLLAGFYRQRLPADICDARAFARWRRRAEARDPTILHAPRELFMSALKARADETRFPDVLRLDGLMLPLEYRFDPGRACDGVTLVIPLAALRRVTQVRCEWLVPGLLEEKILALIKSLPKSLRRHFVPAADYARACTEALGTGKTTGNMALTQALAQQLERMTGVRVPPEAWRMERLAPHLRMHFRLVDENGHVLAEGDDLDVLQAQWAGRVCDAFERAGGSEFERCGITTWDFGVLPERLTLQRNGFSLEAFPALTDEGQAAALRLFDTPQEAERHHREGVLRLLMLTLSSERRAVEAAVDARKPLGLRYTALKSGPEPGADLRSEILKSVFAQSFPLGGEAVRDAAAFERLAAAGRGKVVSQAERLLALLDEILERFQRLHKTLQRPLPPAWLPSVSDMRSQLDELVWPGFISATPMRHLQQYPRYLKALALRLRKLEEQPARDLARVRRIRPDWEAYLSRQPHRHRRQQDEARWHFEERRIALFTQELAVASRHEP